jgi:hypothetical protein
MDAGPMITLKKLLLWLLVVTPLWAAIAALSLIIFRP